MKHVEFLDNLSECDYVAREYWFLIGQIMWLENTDFLLVRLRGQRILISYWSDYVAIRILISYWSEYVAREFWFLIGQLM